MAQAAAQLPPLQPVNRGRRDCAPAPAPTYYHLPVHLAQAAAQLPALQPVNRGRRGRPLYANQNNHWAPVQFQPTIPPVSLIEYISTGFIFLLFYSFYLFTAYSSSESACSCFTFKYS